MERNVWADRFVDNVVRRSERDVISKTVLITLILILPVTFAFVICGYVILDNPDDFDDPEGSVLVMVIVCVVCDLWLASSVLFNLTRKAHRHLLRDIAWMESLEGYVESKGSDASELRRIGGQLSGRGWKVRTAVSAVMFGAVTLFLAAIGVFMFLREGAFNPNVTRAVLLAYAMVLVQFVFTVGATAGFPAKHDRVQCEFTEELERRLRGIGVDQPAMGNEVRRIPMFVHAILFVVTLGLYSFPLLLMANHHMNVHIRSQWRYETELMMKIVRNEGGIGVEGIGDNQPSNAFLRLIRNAM